MRRRFGLSQEAFGKLVGVNRITVCAWEQKPSRLRILGDAKAKLLSLKGVGKKEAARRLAEIVKKNAKKPAKRAKRGKRGNGKRK